MRIEALRCTCLKCGHVFDAEVVMGAPVSVVCASIKAVRCPKCYSDEIGLGGAYGDALIQVARAESEKVRIP
jgi:predicted Zn-ribbon and HTH transcriptional regulator